MRKQVVLTLAVLALTLTASRASAGWYTGPLIPAYQVTYVPQKATYWVPEVFYRYVEVEVQEPTYTKVTKRTTVTVLEEDFRDEEHVGTFYNIVPRTFEVDVVRCKLVRMKISDPCTGNVFWINRPEPYIERVPQVVMEREKELRKWTVRQSYFKPVERTYDQDFTVCELHPKKVFVKQPFTRLVPFETTLLVPVFVPPGAVHCVP